MMGKLLGHVPVQIFEIRPANTLRPVHTFALQQHFQMNIVSPVTAGLQIRRRRILFGTGDTERLQRLEWDDPRRDRRAEVLGQEWAERLISQGLMSRALQSL